VTAAQVEYCCFKIIVFPMGHVASLSFFPSHEKLLFSVVSADSHAKHIVCDSPPNLHCSLLPDITLQIPEFLSQTFCIQADTFCIEWHKK